MPKTVTQMVNEAAAEVPSISPAEARRRQQENPDLVLVDVRDFRDRRASGMAPGAIAVSAGLLPFAADQEVPEAWRHPDLQDRARPVVTMCDLGPMSAMAAKTLKEMGFTDVSYVEGGAQAWKEAGLPTEPPSDT